MHKYTIQISIRHISSTSNPNIPQNQIEIIIGFIYDSHCCSFPPSWGVYCSNIDMVIGSVVPVGQWTRWAIVANYLSSDTLLCDLPGSLRKGCIFTALGCKPWQIWLYVHCALQRYFFTTPFKRTSGVNPLYAEYERIVQWFQRFI